MVEDIHWCQARNGDFLAFFCGGGELNILQFFGFVPRFGEIGGFFCGWSVKMMCFFRRLIKIDQWKCLFLFFGKLLRDGKQPLCITKTPTVLLRWCWSSNRDLKYLNYLALVCGVVS